MSDTQTDARAVETDPNFAVERTQTMLAGQSIPAMKFTFGTPPRTVVKRDLRLSDEFNLIGVAGSLADNSRWMILAGLAWGAETVDGVPVPQATKLDDIRQTLDKIGSDGLSAYLKAATMLANETDADVVAAAKN